MQVKSLSTQKIGGLLWKYPRQSKCFWSIKGRIAKKNTIRNYDFLLSRLCTGFNERELESLTTDEILAFLTRFTQGAKQSTKRLRYSLLSAFFNFIKNSSDPKFHNPCDTPILRKVFRQAKPNRWKILEKEVIDEIIFRTENQRNRLMLELMARGGMRIGEVLKLTPRDIDERKITVNDPKSRRQEEIVFIPQKLADRLKEYIRRRGIENRERIFPITYPAARAVVKKAGRLVGINLRPHDLRINGSNL